MEIIEVIYYDIYAVIRNDTDSIFYFNYVEKTDGKDINKRWNTHLSQAKKKDKNDTVSKVIRDVGEDNVKCIVVMKDVKKEDVINYTRALRELLTSMEKTRNFELSLNCQLLVDNYNLNNCRDEALNYLYKLFDGVYERMRFMYSDDDIRIADFPIFIKIGSKIFRSKYIVKDKEKTEIDRLYMYRKLESSKFITDIKNDINFITNYWCVPDYSKYIGIIEMNELVKEYADYLTVNESDNSIQVHIDNIEKRIFIKKTFRNDKKSVNISLALYVIRELAKLF
jgi:hypothetical protein